MRGCCRNPVIGGFCPARMMHVCTGYILNKTLLNNLLSMYTEPGPIPPVFVELTPKFRGSPVPPFLTSDRKPNRRDGVEFCVSTPHHQPPPPSSIATSILPTTPPPLPPVSSPPYLPSSSHRPKRSHQRSKQIGRKRTKAHSIQDSNLQILLLSKLPYCAGVSPPSLVSGTRYPTAIRTLWHVRQE